MKHHPLHHLHVALPTETSTCHVQKVTLAQSVYCSGCYRLCSGNPEHDVLLSLGLQHRVNGWLVADVSRVWWYYLQSSQLHWLEIRHSKIRPLRCLQTSSTNHAISRYSERCVWNKTLQLKYSCKMMIALSASRQYASLWSGCKYVH